MASTTNNTTKVKVKGLLFTKVLKKNYILSKVQYSKSLFIVIVASPNNMVKIIFHMYISK